MNLDQVARALTDGANAPLGYVDFFARTWQCSHVRYCRGLWDADDYSREEALAWILQRNEENYIESWRRSIVTSSFRASTIQEIGSAIDGLAQEVQDSDYLTSPPKFPVEKADLQDVSFPLRLEGISLYDYGPTAVYVWQRNSEFNYLEIHYES